MRDRGQPDDEGRRVAIAEWESLLEHLDRFCGSGKFTVEDGRATCEFPNAQLTVTADGTVEAGMPLHAFECADVDTLRFRHDSGEAVVRTDDHLRYTFRRP